MRILVAILVLLSATAANADTVPVPGAYDDTYVYKNTRTGVEYVIRNVESANWNTLVDGAAKGDTFLMLYQDASGIQRDSDDAKILVENYCIDNGLKKKKIKDGPRIIGYYYRLANKLELRVINEYYKVGETYIASGIQFELLRD